MERNNSLMTRGHAVLGACVLASSLGACGGGAPTQQLVDARHAYEDAAEGPAATEAPRDLAAARSALERAETAHEEDPGSAREERLARRAEQRAKLADARGEAAQAQRIAHQAKADARREVREADAIEAREDAAEARADAAEARADARADGLRTPKPERVQVTSAKRNVDKDELDTAALQNLSAIASVKQEPRGIVITMSGSLLFPSGKQELSPIARQNLQQVADALSQQPAESRITVDGHTDASGSEAQNEQLAKQRAQAVADQLIASGIAAERIEVQSHGESQPIASNDTADGRATNRRVEIVVSKMEKD